MYFSYTSTSTTAQGYYLTTINTMNIRKQYSDQRKRFPKITKRKKRGLKVNDAPE
jgi:hypothetical protein